MDSQPSEQNLRWYAAREPLVLLALSAVALLGFFAVSALAHTYRRQQQRLADKWFGLAKEDQKAGHLLQAVSEFQAAELYARDNFDDQLGLAETLGALGRADESYTYLLNLRERQPDNGAVNLEMARNLAKKGNAEGAIRYYHNAIYAVWNGQAESRRNQVRL